ncbi:extracellular catalytic domain type 1 short-chain-length polyhydroxyalkanoate depolymerase [Micromonospora tarapacensis]
MTRTRAALACLAAAFLLAVAGVAVAPTPASAASLVEVTNFGNNPGNMRMHIYVPDARPANPAIVVAMHGCGGSGPGFHSGSEFARLADQYGYIVIYPTATQQAGFGNCFDVWSAASKRRDGGSDPVSIMSMVGYAQRQHGGDPQRVYATGSSSGGMMTQALMALYPDVYKAGAAFMGVPFTCFANAADFPPTNSQCVNGRMDRTPQQWGDAVRQAYPGYNGARPRVQVWHGTNDNLIPFQLLQEGVEQWTNVAGLSQTPTSTDTPQANWNRRRYADSSGTVRVEAYSIQGAGHSLPSAGMARVAIEFFGLTGSQTPPPPPRRRPLRRRPPRPHHSTADDAAADHPAADDAAARLDVVPGAVHGRLMEQRPGRQPHCHQHQQQHDQRLDGAVVLARQPAGDQRLERHGEPERQPGDRAQRRLERHHPGQPERQFRPAGNAQRQQPATHLVHPERSLLRLS